MTESKGQSEIVIQPGNTLKTKGTHPIVADNCDFYFRGMRFRAGDEIRNLPEDMKQALLASKQIV